MLPSQRFLDACSGKKVDRIPVWLMRQAGRYLPEYRALREKHSFLTLCKTPELVVEVTLQPIARFKMDAAILFSDILLPLESMGVDLKFDDSLGPQLSWEAQSNGTAGRLRMPDFDREFGFLADAIGQLRRSLGAETALIGFSGAPFTLLTYLIEGGSSRDLATAKTFMYREPASFHRLMEDLSKAVEAYLKFQIRAGAQAVQLFDTWAGSLSPADYREFVLPHTQGILEAVGADFQDVPTIYFALGASTLLEDMKETGARVLGLDWRIDMGKARTLLGPGRPVQGNLDPLALFQPVKRLEGTIRDMLAKGSRFPGYIFNLGHGVHPKTPVEHVQRLVEIVREYPACPAEAVLA
jgi:uroporphyrinogen decarboxylase